MTEPHEQQTDSEDVSKWLAAHAGRGGRIQFQDPRVSKVSNWLIGIASAIVIAGGLGTFNLLFSMRDQLTILTNKPESATKEQLRTIDVRIDNVQSQLNSTQAEIKELRQSVGSNKK